MTDAAPDTGEAPPTEATPEDATADTADLSSLVAVIEELGLTPEQIAGRLNASRKWEKRAKDNSTAATELERIKRESMTEQERIADEAKQAGRAEALTEVGSDRVDDAVRVAATGRGVDVDALLEGLDRTRFITDEHKPDTEAIQAWVDRIAPQPDENAEPVFPDLGQGARGGASVALNGDPLLRDLKAKLGIR